MLIRCTVIFMLTIVSMLAMAEQQPGSKLLVRVLVVGATPNGGQIIGQLFSSEESYLSKPESSTTAEVDEAGGAVLEFQVTENTSYAVAVFQDKNGNSRLDRNFIGIPKEAVGISNNPKGRFGPPKWKAASFSPTEAVTELKIRMAQNIK